MLCRYCGKYYNSSRCFNCGISRGRKVVAINKNSPKPYEVGENSMALNYVSANSPAHKKAIPNQNNNLAIAGFILSCFGCFLIIGLILSIVSLAKAKHYYNKFKGFSIAGISISCLFIVSVIVINIIVSIVY